MAIPSFNNIRHRLGSRTAIVVAGSVGFAIGATGFVAAQDGQPEPAGAGADTTLAVDGTVAMTVPETTAGTTPDSTLPSPTTIELTIPTLPTVSTIDDDTSTTAPDVTIDDTIDDDSTSSTAPDVTIDDTIDDDATSSTTPDVTIDDTIDDDATSSTTPHNTTDDTIDDDATSSTTPHNTTDDTIDDDRPLPGPFTETYSSAGGSVSVSWSGTAFSLNSISPAPGFVAEIEDNAWDRVRVDFEGDDDDFRIEVRLNDRSIRVRID